jgi:hypothetical protein
MRRTAHVIREQVVARSTAAGGEGPLDARHPSRSGLKSYVYA